MGRYNPENVIKTINRKKRRKYSAGENVRIVLESLKEKIITELNNNYAEYALLNSRLSE